MSWRLRLGYMALGVLFALGHAPFGYLVFGAPIAIVLIARRLLGISDWRIGFTLGWWFAFGYFLWAMQWLIAPFWVEPETIWIAPFALLSMAAGLALFWAVPMALAVVLFPAHWQRLLGWTVLFTLGEYARANIFTGLPWAHPFYLLIDTPLAQLAALIGVHGGFLVVLLVILLPFFNPMRLGRMTLYALIVFAVLFSWGWQRENTAQQTRSDAVMVRLVQPNAPQHLKWQPDYKDIFWQRQLTLTRVPAPVTPDVVIWPETSVYYGKQGYKDVFATLATTAGSTTEVIAGYNAFDSKQFRNSLAYIGQDGALIAQYDKHHLVPFGEYFPFPNLADRFDLYGLAGFPSGYAKGDGPRTIRVGKLPAFVPLICYEVIFPQYAWGQGARAEWLVHISNDAWFGRFTGPQQHFAQTRFRAIEQGLPLARAANTGISAMIDPYGGVVDFIALNQAGFLDVALPSSLPPTLYARFGDWVWLCMGLALLAVCLWTRRYANT